MFSPMPTKSYKEKNSKNPRGIVIGVFQVLGSFREPQNPWTWRNYTFETETWPGHGEIIPLKLKLELCKTSKFLHIIICTSDTIFPVKHSSGSPYNIMYWRSLNGQIWLTGEENMLFQVFNIPIFEYRYYIVRMSISSLLLKPAHIL